MKNHIKRIAVFLLLQVNIMYAQNELLSNPGFESKNSSPDYPAQFDKLQSWTSRSMVDENYQNAPTLHSPDFYFENFTHCVYDGVNYQPVQAYKGNGYVGVLDYELFQQELNGSLEIENLYVGSFAFMKSNRGVGCTGNKSLTGSTINVYISYKEIQYEEESDYTYRRDCLEDYRTHKNGFLQRIKKVASFDIDNYPENEWLQESFYFTVDEDASGMSSFEWFAIEVDFDAQENVGLDCSNAYILFDEFSLKTYCHHHCARSYSIDVDDGRSATDQDENLQPGNNIIMEQDIAVNTNNALLYSFDNIHYLKVIIANRWGELFIREYYDPMGLHNASGPRANSRTNFACGWYGNWKDGNLVGSGAYTYVIIAKGCGPGSYYRITGTVNYVHQNKVGDWYSDMAWVAQPYSPPEPFDLSNCCMDGGLLVTNNIIAQNISHNFVDGEISFNNFLLNDGTYIFRSNSNIEIGDNMDIKSQSQEFFCDFELHKSCLSNDVIFEKRFFNSNNITLNNEKAVNRAPYPNPVKSGQRITFLSDIEGVYQLYNVQGMIIKSGFFVEGKNELTLNSAGLKFLSHNGNIFKIIVIE